MNQQLVNYIAEAHKHGMSDEDIRRELVSAGWQIGDINAAFGVESPQTPSPLTLEQQKYITRWSWGGFAMGWIYLASSRLYKKALKYLLLALIPFAGLILNIRLGLKGRAMTWSEGPWLNFDEYQKRQRLLDIIGLIIIISSVVFGIVMTVRVIHQTVEVQGTIRNFR